MASIAITVAVNQEFYLKNLCVVAQVVLCASMAAPGLALAQAMPATKNTSMAAAKTAAPAAVTDAAAAVPGVVYQSVFANTPTGVEMESADWKKANAEVGQFKRGHVDILKWDEAQEKKPSYSPLVAPKSAAGDATSLPAASPPKPSSAQPAPTAPSVHKH